MGSRNFDRGSRTAADGWSGVGDPPREERIIYHGLCIFHFYLTQLFYDLLTTINMNSSKFAPAGLKSSKGRSLPLAGLNVSPKGKTTLMDDNNSISVRKGLSRAYCKQ